MIYGWFVVCCDDLWMGGTIGGCSMFCVYRFLVGLYDVFEFAFFGLAVVGWFARCCVCLLFCL